jgi:hypothetical protein
MAAHADPALVLQAFLDDLVMTSVDTGHTGERLQLLRNIELAGLGDVMVVCDRCRTAPMRVQSLACYHHRDTERHYLADVRDELGPNASMHRPGDFRAAYDGETLPARLRDLPTPTPHWADGS